MPSQKMFDVAENFSLFYDASNGQHSIRALKYFPVNATIHIFSGREYMQQPTRFSVQISEGKHIHLFPEFLQYINHSCQPNTFFDTTKGEIIVVRPIKKDEEVTFFYPSTEWQMANPFSCFCGSINCLGMISGAVNLSEQQLQGYKLNRHILAMLHDRNKQMSCQKSSATSTHTIETSCLTPNC